MTQIASDSVQSAEAAPAEISAEAETASSLIERAVAAQALEPSATIPAEMPAVEAQAADEAPAAALAPSAPITLPPATTDSGLIMIETDPSKRATFGSGAPEQPVRLGRKPRPAPVIVDEPLQQVETHK